MSTNPFEPLPTSEPEPAKKKFRITLVEALVVLAIIGILVGLLMPATRGSRPASRRYACHNHFKLIALAMQNYHDIYKSLPPAYTVDGDGNRLHSWRTLLLPYLEQAPLYQKIDLSKPWNDPVNMAAFGTEPPRVFQCPASRDQLRTPYMVVVDPQSCFPGAEAVDLKKITDGAADTLMFIEAPEGCGVEWMSPYDADWTLLSGVSNKTPLSHKQVFHAAFADGRVISLAPTMEITVRRALLTIAAGDSPGDWEY